MPVVRSYDMSALPPAIAEAARSEHTKVVCDYLKHIYCGTPSGERGGEGFHACSPSCSFIRISNLFICTKSFECHICDCDCDVLYSMEFRCRVTGAPLSRDGRETKRMRKASSMSTFVDIGPSYTHTIVKLPPSPPPVPIPRLNSSPMRLKEGKNVVVAVDPMGREHSFYTSDETDDKAVSSGGEHHLRNEARSSCLSESLSLIYAESMERTGGAILSTVPQRIVDQQRRFRVLDAISPFPRMLEYSEVPSAGMTRGPFDILQTIMVASFLHDVPRKTSQFPTSAMCFSPRSDRSEIKEMPPPPPPHHHHPPSPSMIAVKTTKTTTNKNKKSKVPYVTKRNMATGSVGCESPVKKEGGLSHPSDSSHPRGLSDSHLALMSSELFYSSSSSSSSSNQASHHHHHQVDADHTEECEDTKSPFTSTTEISMVISALNVCYKYLFSRERIAVLLKMHIESRKSAVEEVNKAIKASKKRGALFSMGAMEERYFASIRTDTITWTDLSILFCCKIAALCVHIWRTQMHGVTLKIHSSYVLAVVDHICSMQSGASVGWLPGMLCPLMGDMKHFGISSRSFTKMAKAVRASFVHSGTPNMLNWDKICSPMIRHIMDRVRSHMQTIQLRIDQEEAPFLEEIERLSMGRLRPGNTRITNESFMERPDMEFVYP